MRSSIRCLDLRSLLQSSSRGSVGVASASVRAMLASTSSNDTITACKTRSRTYRSASGTTPVSQPTRLDISMASLARCQQARTSTTAANVATSTCSPAPLPQKPTSEAGTSFLRSFSTSLFSSPLAPTSFPGTILSKMPRLRSEDSPSRLPNRSRRHSSPLFDRPSRRLRVDTSSSSSSSNSNGPGRRPPSTSTVAGIIALMDKRLFSRLPERFVLYTIIALNVLVFGSWLYATETLRKFSDPRAYIFLAKNFLSGYRNVAEGRWWTMLTSCVSHERLDHFLVNMISLAFMAPPVLALTGPTTFMLLYFGAGVVSSIVSMVGKRLTGEADKAAGRAFSHGASGSVYAIMSTFACVHPTATFLVFFVIPAPAWAVVSGIMAWDLWHAAKTPGGATDSAGHVGGILAGILFWRFGLRGVRIQS